MRTYGGELHSCLLLRFRLPLDIAASSESKDPKSWLPDRTGSCERVHTSGAPSLSGTDVGHQVHGDTVLLHVRVVELIKPLCGDIETSLAYPVLYEANLELGDG